MPFSSEQIEHITKAWLIAEIESSDEISGADKSDIINAISKLSGVVVRTDRLFEALTGKGLYEHIETIKDLIMNY